MPRLWKCPDGAAYVLRHTPEMMSMQYVVLYDTLNVICY